MLDVLHAAEWVLQIHEGSTEGETKVPAPPFYHPHTYVTITIKNKGGYLKLSWAVTWGDTIVGVKHCYPYIVSDEESISRF